MNLNYAYNNLMFYTDEQINLFLIEKFNQYQTNYILKIINQLRKLNILTLHNSIEGWNNFVYNYITKIIKETIEKSNSSIPHFRISPCIKLSGFWMSAPRKFTS